MKKVYSVMLAAAIVAPLAQAQQVTSHYAAGVEGIKGASLPPPGLYFRDYNQFYSSDHLRVNGMPSGFNVKVYAQVPRIIYMTDMKILGADYGFDVLVPLVYTHLRAPGGYHKSSFGMGDIAVEPLLLSWHKEKLDISAGYCFWAPTGEFDLTRPDKPGKGFWGHMLTLGATYYLDTEKSWAISALNRYEFNHRQRSTLITPGQQWTMEWGISKNFSKFYDIGLVGYYQVQTTDDHIPGATGNIPNASVVGVGPEISAVCPKLGVIASLRYNYEFAANERFEGHNIALTLTKKF